LKLNARLLRKLGLINFSKGKNAELTINGKVILSVIRDKKEVKNGK
jgi:Mn-dependent DtxR family transcriptional regulator